MDADEPTVPGQTTEERSSAVFDELAIKRTQRAAELVAEATRMARPRRSSNCAAARKASGGATYRVTLPELSDADRFGTQLAEQGCAVSPPPYTAQYELSGDGGLIELDHDRGLCTQQDWIAG